MDDEGGHPQSTGTPPSIDPPPSHGHDYTIGDEKNPNGTTALVTAPVGDVGPEMLQSGEFYVGSGVAAQGGYGFTLIETRGRIGDLVDAQFDAAGALTSFDYDGVSDGGPISGVATGGVESFGQANGVLGWGRWTGAELTSTGGVGIPKAYCTST